jgi:hypothetical protein
MKMSETLIKEKSLSMQDMRLRQDFGAQLSVQKKLILVPVRKPNRQDFVRVHIAENFRAQYALIELKEDREIYVLDPALCSLLPGEAFPAMLFTAMNRQGVLFLWPVRLPREDGKVLEWHRSSMEAAQAAMSHWVKVVANMSLGAYDLHEATADIPEPDWPDSTFDEILNIAFKGRIINSSDHPVIQRLLGRI